MMILSRIWSVIVALLLAAAVYALSLAVGQYNRRNQAAMDETLKADSQVVSWALQVDSRRRLDVLLLAAADPAVSKSLIKGANGKETISAAAKDEGARALRSFNEKLPADYKNDAVFLTDREGRLVAQVGYDAVAAFPEFELGGYAAVFDALHGFLRDETWVWGGRLARVVVRPVEDEVGQPPLGAVVGLRWVDKSFARDIGKRTRTNLAFFALGHGIASAATTEGIDDASLDALGGDLLAITSDKGFKDTGRTDVRPLGTDGKGGALFVRLPGEAWDLNAGFAVARAKVAIDGPLGFLQGADDQDKRNVKLWFVALVALVAAFLGIFLSYIEHTRPFLELKRQAEQLKKGELDVFQLARFRGGYRPIAEDINVGVQRVVEKGGGVARKPADLASILGPVPAQPNMSAFSFPLGPPGTSGGGEGDGPLSPLSPGSPRAPSSGPTLAVSAGVSTPRVSGPSGAPSPLLSAARKPGPPPPANARPEISGQAFPPPFGGVVITPPGVPSQGLDADGAFSQTVAASPQGARFASLQARPAPSKPVISSSPRSAVPPAARASSRAPALSEPEEAEEDDQTMVGPPSAELMVAIGTGAQDSRGEWQRVYEDFLRTKRECQEPVEGLTFEKFQQTLKKNRDALVERHGCKHVKFSVYVKEGRASLKATPVRD